MNIIKYFENILLDKILVWLLVYPTLVFIMNLSDWKWFVIFTLLIILCYPLVYYIEHRKNEE